MNFETLKFETLYSMWLLYGKTLFSKSHYLKISSQIWSFQFCLFPWLSKLSITVSAWYSMIYLWLCSFWKWTGICWSKLANCWWETLFWAHVVNRRPCTLEIFVTFLAARISPVFRKWCQTLVGARRKDSYVPNISRHLLAGMGQADNWEAHHSRQALFGLVRALNTTKDMEDQKKKKKKKQNWI